MNIDIRRAGPQDADAIATLGREAFAAAFGPHNTAENLSKYLASAFHVDNVREELSDPAATFLVAVQDGQDVGFAKLKGGEPAACVRAADCIELERIYVAKGRTGSGIGTPLLFAALQESSKKGYKNMWLGVWEKNHGAIKFYQRHGFQTVGRKHFMLGDDRQFDIVMTRPCQMTTAD